MHQNLKTNDINEFVENFALNFISTAIFDVVNMQWLQIGPMWIEKKSLNCIKMSIVNGVIIIQMVERRLMIYRLITKHCHFDWHIYR